MITKILSGLLFVLTIVVGWNIFSSGTLNIPLQEEPRATVEEVPPMRNTPTFLTRLSLTPSTLIDTPLIAVVIENHEDARPFQKGLDRARVVAEFLVEGLISRFVALFLITDLPDNIGPVRSLRPYFVDALGPWTSLFLYAGGSPEALDTIEKTDIRHINGLYLPDHFVRDGAIAEPHNLFVSKKAITDMVKQSPLAARHLFAPPYGSLHADNAAQEIRVNFFNPDHNVTFTYDPLTASYRRTNGHMETMVNPRNVLILKAPIRGIGSYGRLDIPFNGTGSLLFFQSGKVVTGVWQKDAPEEPFSFFDIQHKPLQFTNGQIWMMVLETMERVKWE